LSMSIKLDLTGDKEVVLALNSLNKKLHKKVLRSATRHALKPALAAALTMIPVDSGTLRDSMKIQVKAFPPFHYVGKVWPKWKHTQMVNGELRRPFKYAHLVEAGHDVTTEKGGEVLGHVEEQPFIRHAFLITGPEIKRRFKASIIRGAKREFNKMVSKVPKRRVA